MCELNCTCDDIPLYLRTNYVSPRSNPHQVIIKLCSLLEEKLAKDMTERHLDLMEKIVKICKNGFHLIDLKYVSKILELVTEHTISNPKYIPYLKKLVSICALPPLFHNATEILSEMDHFQEYISVLGFIIIWLVNKELRIQLFDTIIQLLIYENKTSENTVSVSLCRKAVEGSHLPEIMINLIGYTSEEEYLFVLHICCLMSSISDKICHRMVQVGGVDYLGLRLENTDQESHIATQPVSDLQFWYFDIADITFKVIWNLANSLKTADPKFIAGLKGPCQNATWCMMIATRMDIITDGRRAQRNQKLSVFLRCLDVFPKMSFIDSGLAEIVSILCVATEIRPIHTWFGRTMFNNDKQGIYFKKMLLLSLCYFKKYPDSLVFIERNNVVPGLVKLMSYEESYWSPEVAISLATCVLHVLYVIGDTFLHLFIENDGPLRMLIILESYLMDVGDSVLILACLKTLNHFLHINHVEFRREIHKHFGDAILILMCNKLLADDYLDSADLRLLAYCFCSLRHLRKDSSRPESESALMEAIRYMERVIKPRERDSCTQPRTVICVVDFLWETVMYAPESRNFFIEHGGIYKLLDIIDKSVLPVQTIALGFLVDLAECVESVPFLVTWRGGANKTLFLYSLLARIFLQECRQIGTRFGPGQVIADTRTPLMGENQHQMTYRVSDELSSSPSVKDVIGSCRPKVYALVQLLQTRHSAAVRKLRLEHNIKWMLEPEDRVVLKLAENYLLMKISEAWHELEADLRASEINPTSIDANMLRILVKHLEFYTARIKEKQQEILEDNERAELKEENELYNILRESRLQNALSALIDLGFVARTTDRMFRLQHKRKQFQEIEPYLQVKHKQTCVRHRTYFEKINTTAVFNQKFIFEYDYKERTQED